MYVNTNKQKTKSNIESRCFFKLILILFIKESKILNATNNYSIYNDVQKSDTFKVSKDKLFLRSNIAKNSFRITHDFVKPLVIK